MGHLDADGVWRSENELLEELEKHDPVMRRAARRFTAAMRRLTDPDVRARTHRLPCPDTACPWHHHQPDRA